MLGELPGLVELARDDLWPLPSHLLQLEAKHGETITRRDVSGAAADARSRRDSRYNGLFT